MHTQLNNLKLSALRQANALRIPQFKNAQGQMAHKKPDGSDWSLGDWINATLGEMGEAANLLKKIRRGDYDLDFIRVELAKELADVMCYLDILAMQLDIDLSCSPEEEVTTLRQDRVVLKMTSKFGHIAQTMETIELARENNENPENDIYLMTSLALYFQELIMSIQELAKIMQINLGQAVIDKFNEVSVRVGSSIILSEQYAVDTSL